VSSRYKLPDELREKPRRWLDREPAPWGGGGGRFARPPWFNEPPPQEMARGINVARINNSALGRNSGGIRNR